MAELAKIVPDPFDAVCGWCAKAVALKRHGQLHRIRASDSGPAGQRVVRVAGTYLCPRGPCNLPSLVIFTVISSPQYGYAFDAARGQIPAGSALPMEDLPEEIERDRVEAWECFHAGNVRAAVIMARASVQRAARALNAGGSGLKAEINDLIQRGVVAKEVGEFAHEVRIAGDDAAHPSTLGDVTPEEARESLEFVDDFLRVTVALPERVRRRKAERSAEPG